MEAGGPSPGLVLVNIYLTSEPSISEAPALLFRCVCVPVHMNVFMNKSQE